jgi:exopolyphosphatase/guanosine-5'-triphosphate,3'-diphosphate pyrophosphatase
VASAISASDGFAGGDRKQAVDSPHAGNKPHGGRSRGRKHRRRKNRSRISSPTIQPPQPAEPATGGDGGAAGSVLPHADGAGADALAVTSGMSPAAAPMATEQGKTRRRKRRRRRGPGQPANAAPVAEAIHTPLRNLRQPARLAEPARYEPEPADVRHAQVVQPRTVRPRRAPGEIFAALDLGTNNCRLLLAVPTRPNRFRVVGAFSRIVRLGEGLAATGRLADDAMDRAIEALQICAGRIAAQPLAGFRLIATDACRRAANGREFMARVREETGLELEIIDRRTEAYLAAEGCGALIDRDADGAVLFDIGGGSTEIALIDRRKKHGRTIASKIAAWTSLPVGVVNLSERHGGHVVDTSVFQAMVAEVLDLLARFDGRQSLAELGQDGRAHLLGTSGTVTTIAGVHLNLARYDRRRVDGLWLNDSDIDRVIARLLEMDYPARAANACIGSDRADLVLAGCAILEAIRRTWPNPRLRVADRGLREGILAQLMRQHGSWDSARNPVRQGWSD